MGRRPAVLWPMRAAVLAVLASLLAWGAACATGTTNDERPGPGNTGSGAGGNGGGDAGPAGGAPDDAHDGATDGDTDGATDAASDAQTDGEAGPNPDAIPCTPQTAESLCGSLELCVDGYCCDTPCEKECDRCNLLGIEGTCSIASASTVCREAADLCDAIEHCDGTTAGCPADDVADDSVVCRPAAEPCDAPERCDGVHVQCPADSWMSEGDVCRPAAGGCDLPESCDVNLDCPPDLKSAAECRASAGDCDVAESCDGVSDDCPADAKSTAVCRASGGVCDLVETCDGVGNDCPADGLAGSSVVCDTRTEYRCLGSDCGATAQSRQATQYCSGSSVACDGVVSGTWTTIDSCAANEVCKATAGDAWCELCPLGCLAGSCIEPDPCDAVALSTGFESGASGFTHAPTSGLPVDDPWELGTPNHGGGCHGGSSCWATDLDASYDDCETAELKSPTIDLSACASSPMTVELSFWHWYQFENYSSGRWWDGGALQLSSNNGSSWVDVSPTPGYQGVIDGAYGGCSPDPEIGGHWAWSGDISGGVWTKVTLVVAPAFKTSTFRFRFLFGADEDIVDWGWLIDDVEIRTY